MWCWDNTSDIDKGKKSYPCRYPPVMNWVMLYGFADWPAVEQLKVLDGAHRFGLKLIYDLSRRGISSEFNGGPITNSSGLKDEVAHWLRSNITVVKDHPALLGYCETERISACASCDTASRVLPHELVLDRRVR